MSVTMKDIARIAGVSQAAVSAAFTPSSTSRISEELRSRILGIAKELDYVPNAAAQRLKGGKTFTIGIYGVPYVSILTQSFMLILASKLANFGYNLLSSYGETEDAAFRATKDLIGKGIDGLIISTIENPINKFKLPPVPYVYVPPWHMPGFDFSVDHKYGNQLAAKKLIDCGCRRIGFLCLMDYELNNIADPHVSFLKLAGVRSALEESGIEMPEDYVLTHEASQFKVSKIVKRIIKLQLDGLICANDYIAAKLLRPLIQAGLQIPKDIKVIGYDGLAICDFTIVPLATVLQPMIQLSELTVNTLISRIENHNLNPKACEQFVKPRFYENESCGGVSKNHDKLEKTDTYSTIELNELLSNKQKGLPMKNMTN